MIRLATLAFCCVLSLTAAAPQPAESTQNSGVAASVLPSYATVARLVIGAPLIVDARVRSAARIKGAEAANVAGGHARFYVEADVQALIRGPEGLPARIGYVVDVPLDGRGREPRLKKQRVLVFARAVPARPDQVQLTAANSQQNWTPELDGLVRTITREALAADAPPAVTGVGNAFHVPGSLPGEGETQVFLQTATGAPVSLQVLRRPGEQPRWAVSLGDIVDEAGGPPAPNSLLWYRLACGLPRELPAASLEAGAAENAAVAREDYAMVLQALGPCS
jgi:hypothetical protein